MGVPPSPGSESSRLRQQASTDTAARYDAQCEQHQSSNSGAEMASWRGGKDGGVQFVEEEGWGATLALRQSPAASHRQEMEEGLQQQTGRKRVAFENDQRQETNEQRRVTNTPQTGQNASVRVPNNAPRSTPLPMEVRLLNRPSAFLRGMHVG